MRWTFLLLAVLTLAVAEPAVAAVPATVTLDGRLLTAAGGPVSDGDYTLTFALYAAADATATVWSEQVPKVAVKGGAFSHELGSGKPLGQGVLAAPQGLWLAVTVGSEPELPKTPLRSVLYARRAELAEGLQCAGCVDSAMLGAQVLAGYAKTVDLSGYVKVSELGDYVKASALAKVAGTGQYGDLAGLPVLVKVGAVCGTGLVVKGIKADGSLDCAAMTIKGGACEAGQVVTEVKSDGSVVCGTVTASLPPDGLAAVSNGVLTNIFPSIFASSTAPKAVPDNDPFGILDDITVPDKGVVTALTVAVDISNSDTTGLKVTLLDPANKPYVLFDGGAAGTALKASYPDAQKPVGGDLGAWVGKNPKGKWRLQVVDTKAGPGGSDGQLNAWGITVKTLSTGVVEVKGDLNIDGGVTVGGKALPQVWTASNDTLAPGATLDIDTKLGDQTLAVSAWVKVGNDWKLISPNATAASCPACGTGQDGDFAPTADVVLTGGRWYSFRSFKLPPGITLTSTSGPLLISVAGLALVQGTISASGANATGFAGAAGGPSGFAGGNGDGGLGKGGIGPGAGLGGENNEKCPVIAWGGGGGGFALPGLSAPAKPGLGGKTYGVSTTGAFSGGSGGGGGGIANCANGGHGGGGGGGGGTVVFVAHAITVDVGAKIQANGGNGACVNPLSGGGGGGSGGEIWLRGGAVSLSGTVSVAGGKGAVCPAAGGDGGLGWMIIDSASITGTAVPAFETVDMLGLPGADASSFTLTATNGVAHLKNEGQVARQVRLVVVR